MLQFLFFMLFFFVMMVFLLIKGMLMLWHKMHAVVGIEAGHSKHAMLALPYQRQFEIPHAISPKTHHYLTTPNSNNPNKKIKQRYWSTRYGKVPSLQHLVGVDIDKLDRMPVEAVQLLVAINERLASYSAWQQSHIVENNQKTTPQKNGKNTPTNSQNLSQNWLTEKQFVLNRLINDTIPEAVNQYDQLARFNPQALLQPIHDGMNAEQILIAVLAEVDGQIGGLLDELTHQTSQQLATLYRYVKARTQ